MADFLKDNVQKYVRGLIAKEFDFFNNKEKYSPDKRKVNKGEQRNEQNRSIWRCLSKGK